MYPQQSAVPTPRGGRSKSFFNHTNVIGTRRPLKSFVSLAIGTETHIGIRDNLWLTDIVQPLKNSNIFCCYMAEIFMYRYLVHYEKQIFIIFN